MTTKKIYIVRHGQTDFNLKGIVQGSGVDSSLNQYGLAQSQAFFDAYKQIPFDKIYTSTLKRSLESIRNFLELGISHKSLTGLNEISWGKKEGQPISPEEDRYYHYVLKQWQLGNTSLRIEGGESPDEVVERMKPAVDHIMDQIAEKTVLICMHGRAMRILLCHLLRYPMKSMDLFEHENLCLYLLNYSGSMFSVERYNDTGHLASLKDIPTSPLGS